MISGGAGAWCSRGSREAMPKPVNQTLPLAVSTRMLAGLRSLWISPRACSRPTAAASGTAMRRNSVTSIGRPSKPLERLATGVSQHQHEPALAPEELDRSRRPVAVEVGPQRVFMLEALQ